jgi:hypothetical protein
LQTLECIFLCESVSFCAGSISCCRRGGGTTASRLPVGLLTSLRGGWPLALVTDLTFCILVGMFLAAEILPPSSETNTNTKECVCVLYVCVLGMSSVTLCEVCAYVPSPRPTHTRTPTAVAHNVRGKRIESESCCMLWPASSLVGCAQRGGVLLRGHRPSSGPPPTHSTPTRHAHRVHPTPCSAGLAAV